MGWKVSIQMNKDMVLAALEQAAWLHKAVLKSFVSNIISE